jgi:hypothetical protein
LDAPIHTLSESGLKSAHACAFNGISEFSRIGYHLLDDTSVRHGFLKYGHTTRTFVQLANAGEAAAHELMLGQSCWHMGHEGLNVIFCLAFAGLFYSKKD